MNIQFGQSKELIVRPMQDLTGEQEYVPLESMSHHLTTQV